MLLNRHSEPLTFLKPELGDTPPTGPQIKVNGGQWFEVLPTVPINGPEITSVEREDLTGRTITVDGVDIPILEKRYEPLRDAPGISPVEGQRQHVIVTQAAKMHPQLRDDRRYVVPRGRKFVKARRAGYTGLLCDYGVRHDFADDLQHGAAELPDHVLRRARHAVALGLPINTRNHEIDLVRPLHPAESAEYQVWLQELTQWQLAIATATQVGTAAQNETEIKRSGLTGWQLDTALAVHCGIDAAEWAADESPDEFTGVVGAQSDPHLQVVQLPVHTPLLRAKWADLPTGEYVDYRGRQIPLLTRHYEPLDWYEQLCDLIGDHGHVIVSYPVKQHPLVRSDPRFLAPLGQVVHQGTKIGTLGFTDSYFGNLADFGAPA